MRELTGICTDGEDSWSLRLRTEETDLALLAEQVATMFVAAESPHDDWSGWRVELHDDAGETVYSAPFPMRIVDRGRTLAERTSQREWVRRARKSASGQLH